MATITFPSSPNPATMNWKFVMPSQTNVSGWTGSRQTLASGRGWWECEVNMPPIVGTANINTWRSFIAQLRGSANDFRLPVDPTSQTSAISPLVNGASQQGRSLVTDGWTPSATNLVAGQFVTIGDQLLQLTADVTADGSGNATINFEPNIRVSPADNAPIEAVDPYLLAYMEEEPSLSVGVGYVYSFSFKVREAF